MLCPVHAEEKLRILKGTIDVVLKRDRSIDEWNMSGCHTLRDALGISRLLNVFQRLSDFVKIGSYFPLIHFYGTRKRRHGGAPISAYKDTIVIEAALYLDAADNSVKRKKCPFDSPQEEFHLPGGLCVVFASELVDFGSKCAFFPPS
jgi:hypothetical protein